MIDDDTDSGDEEWQEPIDLVMHPHITNVDDVGSSSRSVFKEGRRKILASSSTQNACRPSDHARTIVHIDVDCFYAQVEMLRNPELKDKPLGIQQKFIVVTCNYKAREYGVTKLMTLKDAKEKCPQLVLVSGEDLTNYRHVSYKISEFLLKYTPLVERLGFDENYLDISSLVEQRIQGNDFTDEVKGHVYTPTCSSSDTGDMSVCTCGCRQRITVGSQVADDIRQALFEEIGITCCAGISYNKLLAKLVGERHKPNQQTTLFPHCVQDLMTSLGKVRKIPGIGSAMMKRLESLGIYTVTDLQNYRLNDLKSQLGESQAEHIHRLSMGIDEDMVHTYGKPQTISDEDSYNYKKCCTLVDARGKIRSLLLNLIKRLEEDDRLAGTMRLTICRIIDNKFRNRESKQCPLPPSLMSKISSKADDVIQRLEALALSLLQKIFDTSKPFQIALMNIAFCNLQEKPKNSISLFFSPKAKPSEKSNQSHDFVCKGRSNCSVIVSDPGQKDLSHSNTQTNERCLLLSQKSGKETVHSVENTDIPPGAVVCTSSAEKRKSLQNDEPSSKKPKQSNDLQGPSSYDRHNPSSEERKTSISTCDSQNSCEGKKSHEGSDSLASVGEIDLCVLAELPVNIQEEIMSQLTAGQKANLTSMTPMTSTKSRSDCGVKTSHRSIISHSQSIFDDKCVEDMEKKNALKMIRNTECDHGHTVSQFNEDSSKKKRNSTVLTSQCQAVQSDSAVPSSSVTPLPSNIDKSDSAVPSSSVTPLPSNIDKSDSAVPSSSVTPLPSNIDREVFLSLPPDIQREVLGDQQGLLTTKLHSTDTKSKASKGQVRKNTTKKTKSNTDGNILKFFNKNP
ncbi:hypothetical protein FSP39_018867 [Pinctada imbricata]|uniref:UmuC domain-containing protein n=1 Tax=Pinctada imbricata TaxID=66713 RepID=A0AA89BXT4_PINIB|nr:hypothetical protein FSP39_018867 [Pinctada imbricata]